jgi:2-methylcitrate dehydratase PrpD
MNETERLARFVARTEFGDIPTSAVGAAKEAIRDYTGVAVYGSGHRVGDRVAEYVHACADGEMATLLGGGQASVAGAALANGTFGHSVDYDDTFESMPLHPTSPIFPAALAAAERDGVSGRDVLAGYIVGVQVAYQVGHATYPAHYEQGWHSTGTIGAFGAAAAAGNVLELEQEAIQHAFGIVASSSSALKKNFGSMTKPLHAGHAAEMGVRSVMLAEAGFTADAAILEGPIGYGEVMTPDGSYDSEAATDGLGEDWGIHDIGFKPYPSGACTHAAMEALRRIVVEHDLSPEDVSKVVATLPEATSETLPHKRPENALQGKFSIEFCLAAILRERDVGLEEFTDAYVTAPETRAVIENVSREYETEEFAGYGGRVRVETTEGESFVAEEPLAPGTPSNPLPSERWQAKFEGCAGAVLSAEAVAAVREAIERFEEPGALDTFLKGVRGEVEGRTLEENVRSVSTDGR